MNFIEFTKDHLLFNEEQQEYFLEIPKQEIGHTIESVHIVNDDGSISDADCDIEEDDVTFTITLDYAANLRINF